MEENKLLAGSTPDVLSPLRGSRLHKTHHCVRNEDGLWRHYSPTRAHEWGHTCTLSLGVYQPHVITRCRNTLHTCSCTCTCIQPPTCASGGLGGGTEKKKNIERNQRKKKPSHEQNLKRGLHIGVKCDNLFMDTAQAWHGSTMVLSGLILPRIPLCRNKLKLKSRTWICKAYNEIDRKVLHFSALRLLFAINDQLGVHLRSAHPYPKIQLLISSYARLHTLAPLNPLQPAHCERAG